MFYQMPLCVCVCVSMHVCDLSLCMWEYCVVDTFSFIYIPAVSLLKGACEEIKMLKQAIKIMRLDNDLKIYCFLYIFHLIYLYDYILNLMNIAHLNQTSSQSQSKLSFPPPTLTELIKCLHVYHAMKLMS